MKKLLTLACLVSISNTHCMNSTTMRFLTAGAIITAPLAVPATHYYRKTERDKQTGAFNEQKDDHFRNFVSGAICGTVPPINFAAIGISTVLAPMFVIGALGDWQKHKPIQGLTTQEKNQAVGFVSGFSLYGTVPLALKILRKGR